MTEQQALETIGAPILEAHSLSWKRAWDDIRGPFNHPDHTNRIRSDLLREHAAIAGRELLPPLGLNYIFDQGQHMFILPETACFIYKKLDEGQRIHRTDTDRCGLLLQSLLIPDVPTFVVGMMPAYGWGDYVGIYLLRPNVNGIGNAWTLNITDGISALEPAQDDFIPLIDESQSDDAPQQKPKPKFKPKTNDKDIGESSEESGSGDGTK
jgi:hypothetical protein